MKKILFLFLVLFIFAVSSISAEENNGAKGYKMKAIENFCNKKSIEECDKEMNKEECQKQHLATCITLEQKWEIQVLNNCACESKDCGEDKECKKTLSKCQNKCIKKACKVRSVEECKELAEEEDSNIDNNRKGKKRCVKKNKNRCQKAHNMRRKHANHNNHNGESNSEHNHHHGHGNAHHHLNKNNGKSKTANVKENQPESSVPQHPHASKVNIDSISIHSDLPEESILSISLPNNENYGEQDASKLALKKIKKSCKRFARKSCKKDPQCTIAKQEECEKREQEWRSNTLSQCNCETKDVKCQRKCIKAACKVRSNASCDQSDKKCLKRTKKFCKKTHMPKKIHQKKKVDSRIKRFCKKSSKFHCKNNTDKSCVKSFQSRCYKEETSWRENSLLSCHCTANDFNCEKSCVRSACNVRPYTSCDALSNPEKCLKRSRKFCRKTHSPRNYKKRSNHLARGKRNSIANFCEKLSIKSCTKKRSNPSCRNRSKQQCIKKENSFRSKALSQCLCAPANGSCEMRCLRDACISRARSECSKENSSSFDADCFSSTQKSCDELHNKQHLQRRPRSLRSHSPRFSFLTRLIIPKLFTKLK